MFRRYCPPTSNTFASSIASLPAVVIEVGDRGILVPGTFG
jgi:hypothetical protein